MTPTEAIAKLEDMQKQIIHGSTVFGEIAALMRKLLKEYPGTKDGSVICQVVRATDYSSAMAMCNEIDRRTVILPIRVSCGHSTFTITESNYPGVSLGILMASCWKEE